MEQTRWEEEQEDREGLVQDFVDNCKSAPAEVPEFDRAMCEVLSRLEKEPFLCHEKHQNYNKARR